MRELGWRPRSATHTTGKLQALGGVDRHQPHGVGLHALDRSVRLDARGVCQVVDAIEKATQVAALGGLEAPCQAQQLVHVGQPSLTPLQR